MMVSLTGTWMSSQKLLGLDLEGHKIETKGATGYCAGSLESVTTIYCALAEHRSFSAVGGNAIPLRLFRLKTVCKTEAKSLYTVLTTSQ